MASVVNLADEVLDGVLQAAEHLQGSVVAAEAGAIEALRWAGALPLLLRDLGVTKLVSTDLLWAACRRREQVVALLHPQLWGERRRGDMQPETEEDNAAALVEPIEHLVVIVTGFLWDYEAKLIQLLQFGVVQRLTVCSSLSERAHECYDFDNNSGAPSLSRGGRGVKKMDFREFASAISAHNAFQKVSAKRLQQQQQPQNQLKVPLDTQSSWSEKKPTDADRGESEGGDDEWGWSEESSWEEPTATPAAPLGSVTPLDQSSSAPAAVRSGVDVIQLPLNFAPLLSSKGSALEPSVFVLCHPICATAFPLLLSHVVNSSGALASFGTMGINAIGAATGSVQPVPTYSHVKDVAPEHIPNEFRRSLKLLAHTLGEMLVNMRLDFKERIFTMGATSLKIGHTLVRDCAALLVRQ